MDFTVLLEVLRLPELRLVGSRGVYQHPKEDAALFLALSLSFFARREAVSACVTRYATFAHKVERKVCVVVFWHLQNKNWVTGA